MDAADLDHRFKHHPPDEAKAKIHQNLRGACRGLADYLNQTLPEGREKSLAITHLEEVMMWSNASIARAS